MTRRRYQSGMRWCLWRWTDVRLNGVSYLERLHILQTPWFAIMLHWIRTPDPQIDLHDHPVSFIAFVLRGEYDEWIKTNDFYKSIAWTNGSGFVQRITRRWINFKWARDRHRITRVAPNTLTLVVCGPVVRSWGFHTPNGWVGWRDYEKAYK